MIFAGGGNPASEQNPAYRPLRELFPNPGDEAMPPPRRSGRTAAGGRNPALPAEPRGLLPARAAPPPRSRTPKATSRLSRGCSRRLRTVQDRSRRRQRTCFAVAPRRSGATSRSGSSSAKPPPGSPSARRSCTTRSAVVHANTNASPSLRARSHDRPEPDLPADPLPQEARQRVERRDLGGRFALGQWAARRRFRPGRRPSTKAP